ncbi:hypothetical protein DV738_g35, partial [Chaetothyriales sp. CBS 135597]
MALHGLHGLQRRSPQDAARSSTIPATIGPNQATASLDGSIVSATENSALTIITTSATIIPAASGTDTPEPTVVATTITVTDSASFAALTSTESSTQDGSSTASTASTSSASSANSSSSNLSTLIPAIVVPVAVILLASFGLFWFFMRRRHLRELENTVFDMAGKGEKLSSRSTSNRSTGSPISAAVKAIPVVAPSPITGDAVSQPAPRIPLDEIGVARPLTPKDTDSPGARPRSPGWQYSPTSRDRPQYQNFSGPRPSSSRSGPPSRLGLRSQSASPHGPRPGAYAANFHPARNSPRPRAAPSPVQRSGPSPTLTGTPRALPGPPRPAPTPPGPPAYRLRDPSPTMGASMSSTRRAPAPPSLTAPPPGAYNGGSSISQYSPIVKETPNVHSALGSHAPQRTKASPSKKPPPIITTHNLSAPNLSRSPTTTDTYFSRENLRIAQLANSSKLGSVAESNSPSDVSAGNNFMREVSGSDDNQSNSPLGTASHPSPKLPPPATRSQLIPSHSPNEDRKLNYFNSPTRSRPVSSASNQYLPAMTTTQPGFTGILPHRFPNPPGGRRHDEHTSFISAMDTYEDIEARSDISSLNGFNAR